jgi:hypothetical protein
VKCLIFLLDVNDIWNSLTDFHKSSNVRFVVNRASGSQADMFRQTDKWTAGLIAWYHSVEECAFMMI